MNIFRLKDRINYFIKAKNEHSIHSPFMFELYCKTIKKNRRNPNQIINKLIEEFGEENILHINPSSKELENLSSKINHKSIIIIKEPHCSQSSLEEYRKIILQPKLIVNVDLYNIGISFCNTKLKRQNYTLK
ncbi:MAG: hypothetical protein H6Q15_728 [Bacteroidetes bacterium]|nr:hypothetical protein [Bacteroidota bacterium]